MMRNRNEPYDRDDQEEMIDDYEEMEQDISAVSLSHNIRNDYIGQGIRDVKARPVFSKEANRVFSSMDHMNRNKRVLLINTVAAGGSVARITMGLYHALEEHGYECLVAFGRGPDPEDCRYYRIGTDTDVYLHGGLSRITDRHGFYSTSATKELIRVIEDYDPDIIHLHNLHGYYLNVRVLFDYLHDSRRRVIWTLHDCWAFTGHCSHFEYIGCQKWQTCCDSCEQLNEYPKSIAFDNSKRNFLEKKMLFTGLKHMTIVTPSQWLADRVKQSFLKEYPVVVVPTGIDLSMFKPIPEVREKGNLIFELKRRMGIRGKTILLGVANPWRERKGLHQFVNLSKMIDDRTVIVLLGLNDEQLEELPDSIIGLARTESIEEMVAIYSMADIYVNLTLEDTFPTTNLEALACGKPVITFKAGGSPESLDDTCGIVVERNSIQGVVAAIDKIRANRGICYTPEMCMRRAEYYSKEYRFMEYIQEVYDMT
ncbi:MAG: glycosyltransferase [Lachnospiraceae bacterium]|nr:glycosyltransferase [Lachnospiraceae bacterium]